MKRTLPSGPISHVTGIAMALRGDDIDTDRIMPARFLRVLTFEGLGEHVFEDDRQQAAKEGHLHAFDAGRFAEASILVVNRNFGCGSSREHAPQGLLRRGIRAIVGESFSEIFFGNATALGVPCVVAGAEDVASLMGRIESDQRLEATVDLQSMTVRAGAAAFTVGMPAAVRQALLDGSWDATGLLLDRFDQVREAAGRLPYVRGWD